MLTIAVVIIAVVLVLANLDIVLGFAVLAGALALGLAVLVGVIAGGVALYIHAPEVFVFLVIAGIFYAAYYMYSKRVK